MYLTVLIISVESMLYYRRERLFDDLSRKMALSSQCFVIRGGKQLQLTDDQLRVGFFNMASEVIYILVIATIVIYVFLTAVHVGPYSSSGEVTRGKQTC